MPFGWLFPLQGFNQLRNQLQELAVKLEACGGQKLAILADINFDGLNLAMCGAVLVRANQFAEGHEAAVILAVAEPRRHEAVSRGNPSALALVKRGGLTRSALHELCADSCVSGATNHEAEFHTVRHGSANGHREVSGVADNQRTTGSAQVAVFFAAVSETDNVGIVEVVGATGDTGSGTSHNQNLSARESAPCAFDRYILPATCEVVNNYFKII